MTTANEYAVGRVRHARSYAVEPTGNTPAVGAMAGVRRNLGSALAYAFQVASESGKAQTVYYLSGNRWHACARVTAWP